MTHLDLFSGIGGFALAASRVWDGYESVAHAEVEAFACEVYHHHFPGSECLGDITKIDWSKYEGKIDLITGGFPCQPFSVAGGRRGTEDDRHLWPQMLRCIREVRPKWVVAENVAGLLGILEPECVSEVDYSEPGLFHEDEHKGDHKVVERIHRRVIGRIVEQLDEIGYILPRTVSGEPIVLCVPACGVGAPHRRDRIWIVAHAKSEGELGKKRLVRETQRRPDRSVLLGSDRSDRDAADPRRQHGTGSTLRQEPQEATGQRSTAEPQRPTPRHRDRDAADSLNQRDRTPESEHSGDETHNEPGQRRSIGGTRRHDLHAPDPDRNRPQEPGPELETGGDGQLLQVAKNAQRTELEKCLNDGREGGSHTQPSGSGPLLSADPEELRLQGSIETDRGEREESYDELTHGRRREQWQESWYEVATSLCRVDDGVPHRVDRLKSLGNAIVPAVAEEIFEAIKGE